jgi:hypothetical protein
MASTISPLNQPCLLLPRKPRFWLSSTSLRKVSYNNGSADVYKVRVGTAGFDGKGNGGWFGWPSLDSTCTAHCNTLLANLKAAGKFLNAVNDYALSGQGSDLNIRLYSTGIVPVTFVRSSVGSHLYQVLKRGTLDYFIENALAPLYTAGADRDTLRRVLGRFGTSDEPSLPEFRAEGMISAKMQDKLRLKGDTTSTGMLNRPLYITNNMNFDAMRLVSGDMDTTRVKLVHAVAVQPYPVKAWTPIPVTYANPDEMDTLGTYMFYGLGYKDTFVVSDTIRYRELVGNSGPDYNYFTTVSQVGIPPNYSIDYPGRPATFGSFMDYRQQISAVGDNGPMIPKLARAVDAAQFKYASRPNVAPHPVWYVVQVHGHVWTPALGFVARPPTPEDIICQSFLGLNCGINSMMFSDFVDNGTLLGVMRDYMKGKSNQEYGLFENWNTIYTAYPSLKLWTGFPSRYNAVKRVIDHFKDTLLPVYKKLIYNQEQMSVHDSARQSFTTMPLLDTLIAERALADSLTIQSYSPKRYDLRSQTYMEVTHFTPGVYDTAGRKNNARYLLITNRRLWPIDFNTYNADSVRHRFDNIATFAHYDTLSGYQYSDKGLGNIDVRRPWVRLKNTTGIVADSFRIEKVGGGFTRTVTADSLVALDWQKPGWGDMYKVTPIPRGVSTLGTAYNNAVRSENISTDATDKQRIAVFERDSAVYLSVQDENGVWGREFLISDSSDAIAKGPNRGIAFHPAVATVRNGTSCMVVYERYKQSTGHSVRVVYMPTLPTTTSLPTLSRANYALWRIKRGIVVCGHDNPQRLSQ